jgi:hypothetical protein
VTGSWELSFSFGISKARQFSKLSEPDSLSLIENKQWSLYSGTFLGFFLGQIVGHLLSSTTIA